MGWDIFSLSGCLKPCSTWASPSLAFEHDKMCWAFHPMFCRDKVSYFLGSFASGRCKAKNLISAGCLKWGISWLLVLGTALTQQPDVCFVLFTWCSLLETYSSDPITCVITQGSTATTCWCWWGVKCFGVLQETRCRVQDELPVASFSVICCRWCH